MQNLSISKIHKLNPDNPPLGEWIENEKALYEKKQNDGRSSHIIKDMDFQTWLNHRHVPKYIKKIEPKQKPDTKISDTQEAVESVESTQNSLDATGDSGSVLANILNKTAEKLNTDTTNSGTSSNTNTSGSTTGKSGSKQPIVNKTILGMKPVVFYAVTGSVILVAGLLIFKIIKKTIE